MIRAKEKPQLGLILVVVYTLIITIADAITKQIGAGYQAPQLFVISGIIMVALTLIAAGIKGSYRRELTTGFPAAMAIRSVATVVAAIGFFQAFRLLPFADVFLFIGLMPVMAALMAGPALGERIGQNSWIALGLGCVGVMCLMPGGLSSLSIGHLVALIGAMAGTVSMVMSRRIALSENRPLAQLFYPNLSLLLTMSCALPLVWRPMGFGDVLLGVCYGVSLFVARWLLVQVLARMQAHTATTWMKLQFVWMVFLGGVLFGEWPGVATYFGGGIIVLSGLILLAEDKPRVAGLRIPVKPRRDARMT